MERVKHAARIHATHLPPQKGEDVTITKLASASKTHRTMVAAMADHVHSISPSSRKHETMCAFNPKATTMVKTIRITKSQRATGANLNCAVAAVRDARDARNETDSERAVPNGCRQALSSRASR